MNGLLRKAGKAAVAGALAVGAVAGGSAVANAAPPGSVILSTPKTNMYCTLSTSASLGFYHGDASCYNGSWDGNVAWSITVTCVGGSTAVSGITTTPHYRWGSISAGWCWNGVQDIAIREW
ncbi:hypothetical protein ACFFSW_17035 [Saccharothrix longispora]|uniref:Uncharacterized protein n=1 Tax=Saccharothrix longispora TaxID=33920 RepID=A0ABU1PTP9_9PSEU|nr:hypothetical protein [Saccharothrix longispora]MDR6593653.1 hypothetical protein [Saccharothrix longispora]